jgi:hypothetical protein
MPAERSTRRNNRSNPVAPTSVPQAPPRRSRQNTPNPDLQQRAPAPPPITPILNAHAEVEDSPAFSHDNNPQQQGVVPWVPFSPTGYGPPQNNHQAFYCPDPTSASTTKDSTPSPNRGSSHIEIYVDPDAAMAQTPPATQHTAPLPNAPSASAEYTPSAHMPPHVTAGPPASTIQPSSTAFINIVTPEKAVAASAPPQAPLSDPQYQPEKTSGKPSAHRYADRAADNAFVGDYGQQMYANFGPSTSGRPFQAAALFGQNHFGAAFATLETSLAPSGIRHSSPLSPRTSAKRRRSQERNDAIPEISLKRRRVSSTRAATGPVSPRSSSARVSHRPALAPIQTTNLSPHLPPHASQAPGSSPSNSIGSASDQENESPAPDFQLRSAKSLNKVVRSKEAEEQNSRRREVETVPDDEVDLFYKICPEFTLMALTEGHCDNDLRQVHQIKTLWAKYKLNPIWQEASETPSLETIQLVSLRSSAECFGVTDFSVFGL